MEKIIYLNSDALGNGSEELGKILTRNFLLTVLADETVKINAIFLVNGAVRLACENSHVLDALSEFAAAGAKIFSCGTCLDYYGLKDKLKAGEPGNMKSLCSFLTDGNVYVIRP